MQQKPVLHVESVVELDVVLAVEVDANIDCYLALDAIYLQEVAVNRACL